MKNFVNILISLSIVIVIYYLYAYTTYLDFLGDYFKSKPKVVPKKNVPTKKKYDRDVIFYQITGKCEFVLDVQADKISEITSKYSGYGGYNIASKLAAQGDHFRRIFYFNYKGQFGQSCSNKMHDRLNGIIEDFNAKQMNVTQL